MKFASMLRRLRNTQSGMGSTARSRSTPYSEPPVADAGSDQIVSVGDTVNFDGSGSTGSNLSYSWDFGSGADPTTATTAQASCKYTTPGEKTVTLTVTDGRGVESMATLTVTAVLIEPKTVNDGESVDFEVLGAEIATAFSWGWRLPSDLGLNPVVGNNPEVVFSVDYLNPTTIDRAKWYAHPNVACGAKNRIARKSSKYTITCDITFPNGRSFTATSTLTVNVPWQEAGLVRPGIKIITYETETVVEDNIEVLKIKEGTLKAERVFEEEFNIPSSSYFYDKMLQHENKHVEQFNPGGIAADLFNVPQNLWEYPHPTQEEISLKDARGNSLRSLELSIRVRLSRFNTAETQRFVDRRPAMEREAYSVSDPLDPQYIYQRCNRFSGP